MKKELFRKELEEKILATLKETDPLTWIKEWAGPNKRPMNGATKIHYKGVNTMNLMLTAKIKGYKDSRWYTMNQIKDVGGKYHKGQKWHLKSGTKGTWVEYWGPYDIEKHKMVSWEEYANAIKNDPEAHYSVIPRYACVFNADCIEGVPEMLWKPVNEGVNPSETIVKISAGMGVPIYNDGGDRAFYSPSKDEVHLPPIKAFNTTNAYNMTALHELCHATGHKSRLDRKYGAFGDETYASEELVAEIAAAFSSWHISNEIDNHSLDNTKAYVQSWAEVIEKDPAVVIKAVQEAQKAADYIDGLLAKEE